jgi:hypothetical protein
MNRPQRLCLILIAVVVIFGVTACRSWEPGDALAIDGVRGVLLPSGWQVLMGENLEPHCFQTPSDAYPPPTGCWPLRPVSALVGPPNDNNDRPMIQIEWGAGFKVVGGPASVIPLPATLDGETVTTHETTREPGFTDIKTPIPVTEVVVHHRGNAYGILWVHPTNAPAGDDGRETLVTLMSKWRWY